MYVVRGRVRDSGRKLQYNAEGRREFARKDGREEGRDRDGSYARQDEERMDNDKER
jgi:hypothetical protein